MAEIIMPKMGDAMTEGKVLRWYKKAGDVVKKGEPVAEIETDKVKLDLGKGVDFPNGQASFLRQHLPLPPPPPPPPPRPVRFPHSFVLLPHRLGRPPAFLP